MYSGEFLVLMYDHCSGAQKYFYLNMEVVVLISLNTIIWVVEESLVQCKYSNSRFHIQLVVFFL